jgi:hypothetical protein
MNNWYQIERMSEEHRKDIAEFFEHERLVKAASGQASHHSHWADRFLAWLGGHMEDTGHRLKENHSLEAHHREARRHSFG